MIDSCEQIAEQVAAVIDHNIKQQFHYPDSEKFITKDSAGIQKLIREWASNKMSLIASPLFNNEVIRYLGEINIAPNVPEEDEDYYISDFISKILDCKLEGKICQSEWEELTNFFYEQKHGFFINQVINDYFISDFFLDKGRKISRCIKYFIKNDKIVKEIQDLYSSYTQKRKIKGSLYISVHPLDYLSSSENTYHWRSCHALNGDYRSGNLSYMLDTASIVCYVKGRDGAKLPRFPDDVLWNDKKWRMMIHIQNGFFAFGRQYPFESDDLRNLIYKRIKEICPNINFSSLRQIETKKIQKETSYGELVTIGVKKCVKIEDAYYSRCDVIDSREGTCFNDLLYSSFYDFWYFYDKTINQPLPYLKIGSLPHCAKCGKRFINSDDFLCKTCIDDYYNFFKKGETNG